MLEAPTGIGKSAIAVTLSRWVASNFDVKDDVSRGGVIITSQKTLQDQYTRDFSTVAADLRSSSNYECSWTDGVSCAEALRIARATSGWPCRVELGCSKGQTCPYKVAKTNFISSTVGITNYSYFLSELTYTGALKPRQLMSLDECHRVSDEIRKWATVQVDDELCKELGIRIIDSSSDKDVLDWFDRTYAVALATSVERCAQQLLSYTNRKKKVSIQLKNLSKLHEFLDKKMCQLNRWKTDRVDVKQEYVVVRSVDNGNRSIELKPLDVSRVANDVLYKNSERIVMMSATILDRDSFSRTCGVSRDDSEFIQVSSPFRPSQFGIVYRPVAKMSRDQIESSTPRIVEQVKEILSTHPDSKGVIHCASYNVTRAISKIGDSRLLVQSSGEDREKMIETHVTSPNPTVLVSPAMMEGLDLHDDLGRFQVICKIPFPYIGDVVVKKLMEKSQKWYAWKTALAIVQAVGRCVRNEDDWSKTYILDESFGSFFVRWSKLFTSSFSEMEIDDSVLKER